jgi:hypothetical protein
MTEKERLINLSEIILSFTNWRKPQEFEAFVLERATDIDKKVFKNMWAAALDFNNWKNESLDGGCRKAIAHIKEHYQLDEKVLNQIVNAAAYQWK